MVLREPCRATCPCRNLSGGRSVFNGQITVQPVDSPWSVIGQVTNLTNKYYLYELFTGSTVATAGVVAPPREFTVTARRSF